jgi:hypothetical protein
VGSADDWAVQARHWSKRLQRAAGDAAGRVDERTGAVTSARGQLDRLRGARDRAVVGSAQTEAGRTVGDAVRRLAGLAARLPVLSVTTDAITNRHGIPVLVERFRADPSDPMAGVHLLEALARADRDRRRYRAVRTVVDPTSWVVRTATSTAGAIGRETTPFADRLGRSVYGLAAARLREDPADAVAWHGLARVHLLRGDADGAHDLAALAALADPDHTPAALITVARAELARRRLTAADRAAQAAAERGHSVGFEVLVAVHEEAALLDPDPATRAVRLERLPGLLGLVEPAHREHYHGIHVGAGAAVRGTAASQKRKADDLTDRLRAAAAPAAGTSPAPAPAAEGGTSGE